MPDGRSFPNPFGKTLCVPHLAFYPLRFLVQALFHFVYVNALQRRSREYHEANQKKTQLLKWQNARRQRLLFSITDTSIRERELQRRVKVFQADMCSVISDCTVLSADVAGIVTEYIDLEDACIAQMAEDCDECAAAWRKWPQKVVRIENTRHFIALLSSVLSFIACIAQFDLWLNSPQRRGTSAWYRYHAFLMALLQVSGAPMAMLTWAVFSHKTLMSDTSFRKRVLNANLFFTLTTLRAIICILPLAPFILSHLLPAFVVYFGMSCCVNPPLYCVFYAVDYAYEHFNHRLFEVALKLGYAMFAAFVELVLVMYLIAFIGLFVESGFTFGLIAAVTGNYCDGGNHWIVFKTANFTWREWVVLINWFL